jgi:hypothetical protein
LFHPLDRPEKFNLQFGRIGLCRSIGKEDRIEWRKCELGQEEEIKAVERFRAEWRKWSWEGEDEGEGDMVDE